MGDDGLPDQAFHVVFVRLVTLDTERRLFSADPKGYANQHLTGRAALALAAVDPAGLERFARSLTSKRWSALARVVPLTARVVPDLGLLYRRWLGEHPSPGDRPGLSPGESEALRALAPLRRALLSDEGQAPWAADLLAFEAFRACSRRDGRVRTLKSVWPLDTIAQALQSGEIPLDPEPGTFAWQFTGGRR